MEIHIKSCVEYYNCHGSNVIVTMLDCSKAFDTISHYGIFLKLMNRGVPVCFLNLMIYWYLNMKSRCRWEDAETSNLLRYLMQINETVSSNRDIIVEMQTRQKDSFQGVFSQHDDIVKNASIEIAP